MVCKRDFDHPSTYRIRIYGRLDESRSCWFDDLEIENEPDEVTRLMGEIADQAALYGVLARVRDLGLPLLTVERL